MESLRRAVHRMTDVSTISEEEARLWLDAYKNAWETRDAKAALALFTDTAEYREKRFGQPLVGRDDLHAFWQGRIFDHQRDIEIDYQLWAINGDVFVAGWQATFTWIPINGIMELDAVCRVHLVHEDGKVLCSQFHKWMEHREFR